MPVIVAIPLFSTLFVLQSSVLSQIHLLQGVLDLPLLALAAWTLHERVRTAWHWAVIAGVLGSLFTALPIPVVLLNFLIVVGLGLILRHRVWKIPVLAMLVVTFISIMLNYIVAYAAIAVQGTLLPPFDVLNLVILPSLLLNLLAAIPVYAVVSDLANWLHPQEIEV